MGHLRAIQFSKPPERIVSLVPSVTASLLDMGLGERLVGVTDYCIYPAEWAGRFQKVGGPKSLDGGKIRGLEPDLVIANREENDRQEVELLMESGLPVWVQFPKTVAEAIQDLWQLDSLFPDTIARERLHLLEKAYEWAQFSIVDMPPLRYFCPIWEGVSETGQRWWMTFNQDTYPADLLKGLGGTNIFAERQRRFPFDNDLQNQPGEEPGERDTRYPRVVLEEVLQADPEVILLPTEPYAYGKDRMEGVYSAFAGTSACKMGRVVLVEGSLLFWPGTQLGKVLAEIPDLFSRYQG